MQNNDLIKYEGGLIKRVGNAISVTNKLLAVAEPLLIPYRKGDKWGFCKVDKKIVIDCIYDSANLFSENFAVVSQNGKYGYMNKQGKIVIDFEYDNADSFFHNLSVIEKSKKKGVINKINKLIVEPNFDDLYFRRDDCIHVKLGNNIGLMDINFQEIIKPQYQDIGIFSQEGLASFRTNNLCGYINREGDVVILPRFDNAEEFKNGVAVVEYDEEYFLIDLNGNRIADCLFMYLESSFIEGENLYACSKDDLHFGFIDGSGNEVIPFIYDYAKPFSEGLAVICKDGKAGYIDKNNTIIIKPEYETAYSFSEGLARVKKNGKEGFIDKEGNVAIPFLFEPSSSITSFENGYVEVVFQNKSGVIDKNGEIIIPFDFTSVFYDSEIDIFLVSQYDSKLQFISKNGLKYWED